MANPLLIIRAAARSNFAKRFLNGTKLGKRIFNNALTKQYGKQVKLIEEGERFVRKFEKVEGNKRTWTYLDKSYNELWTNELVTGPGNRSVRTITNGSTHSVRERDGVFAHTFSWSNGCYGGRFDVPVNYRETKIFRNYANDGKYTYFSTPRAMEKTVKNMPPARQGYPLPGDGLIHPNPEVEKFFEDVYCGNNGLY